MPTTGCVSQKGAGLVYPRRYDWINFTESEKVSSLLKRSILSTVKIHYYLVRF